MARRTRGAEHPETVSKLPLLDPRKDGRGDSSSERSVERALTRVA
jgi:hypothetical protein